MKTDLAIVVRRIAETLPRELRPAAFIAYDFSDGTLLGFQQELAAQCFDYPELDVQDFLDKIAISG